MASKKVEKKSKRQITGVVQSTAMEKTVKVIIEKPYRHPVYHKVMTERKTFMARNERADVEVGDTVVIEESRPYAKNVKWKVVEVIKG